MNPQDTTATITPAINSDLGNIATLFRWLYEVTLQKIPPEFVESITLILAISTKVLAITLILIAIHTLVKYLWLTWYFHHLHKTYQSPYNHASNWQMFWALVRAAVAYNGMTIWLRKKGQYQDTHLLHIKRPRSFKDHLWPVTHLTERKLYC